MTNPTLEQFDPLLKIICCPCTKTPLKSITLSESTKGQLLKRIWFVFLTARLVH